MTDRNKSNRRNFIKESSLLTAGLIAAPMMGMAIPSPLQESDNIYLIGPQKGYAPQVGTLLSTMTMMRQWVIGTVEGMTVEQLDYQIDDQSNSIGAMLFHLAATERYYQLNTFDGIEWGKWSDEIKKEWDVAMSMGEEGRSVIKGNPIEFYLSKLEEVREVTKKEFAKRDDEWIMKAEPFFGEQMTNNYCKWFHVCEHESNHRGQMKFIIKRIPA